MKKYAQVFIAILILILATSLSGHVRKHEYLLSEAKAVNAGAMKTNGTHFDSPGVSLEHSDKVTLTVVFARAAGSSSTVDVEIEVSPDNGATWALLRSADGTALLRTPTNEPVITGTTVRRTYQINAIGISHFRVKSVENTDVANNITDFNVQISL